MRDRQADIQADINTYIQRNRHWSDIQEGHTYIHTYRQTGRQAVIQTYINTICNANIMIT